MEKKTEIEDMEGIVRDLQEVSTDSKAWRELVDSLCPDGG